MIKSAISACLIVAQVTPVLAFQAQEPPPAEARRLIQMAQEQKTNDGSTVLEALQYAEKMRPGVFKLTGPFDFSYSSDGTLYAVGVCYWIGQKRRDGDKYCDISWEISADHKKLLTPPEAAQTVTHLLMGRDTLLDDIDLSYKTDCINEETGKKYC